MVSAIYYNFTNITDGTGNKAVALMQMTSQYTDYTPGLMILRALWFIVFFSLKIKGYATSGCFIASNLAFFVVALLLYPIGVISGGIFVFSIFLVMIGTFMLFVASQY